MGAPIASQVDLRANRAGYSGLLTAYNVCRNVLGLHLAHVINLCCRIQLAFTPVSQQQIKPPIHTQILVICDGSSQKRTIAFQRDSYWSVYAPIHNHPPRSLI